ncbi:MAG TPA: helix-turn-helix domain-containing protein [Chitinophaga sp.]|uniref:helix-turn-helix domain-containing protein n=1 Tax=Chitinophaga sp. TaxID=1869181 RepID=UPI002C25BF1E|nr:helix-turn-helix domain-containing protein [Chitinophaga sp.]HVI44056.1 helix-turn-helix domain-containing protein [Chitinophaga sp.]
MIFVIAIGAFQALTAVILLWKNRLRSKADTLLILLLCCIATHLAIKFYIYSFVKDDHVRTQMNTFIGFCYGPLLYLYALKNKNESFIPASRWYVFIPFILGAISYLTVICVLSLSVPAGYAALDIYNNSTIWLFLISGFTFPALAIRIARQLQGIPQEKRLIENIGYCLMGICAVSLPFLLMKYTSIQTSGQMILCRNIVYTLLLVVCLIIIRYKYVGLMGATDPSSPHVPGPAITAARAAVRKTQLTAAEHKTIWDTLEVHLSSTKIFTDADLNLDKLAQAVGISKYHISETLNCYASRSFYQYINEWRIRRAAEQLRFMAEKSLPVNILTLAYDCGFKAKSSFNLYFKKITGVTPTEYVKNAALQIT